MSLVEINFDGLIGPSHNYAGLSPGNLAATTNAGRVSHPRRAALQGVAKMRANLELGLVQGIFVPLARPNRQWLDTLSVRYSLAPDHLQAQSLSASSMWAANAATVSPAPDTFDGRCHLTVANLQTMPHRSHEWPGTLAQLKLAFAAPTFVVHSPIPPPFGDEGAANHMRLCSSHDAEGIELFVFGVAGGPYPARQHREASEAIARSHCLDPARTLFVEQSEAAIAAGAFHNDVVAVANERVLFVHESAFADPKKVYSNLRDLLPAVEIVEVPTAAVSLADAIASYLFNAQLVTDRKGVQTLIVPAETQAIPAVKKWVEALVGGNGPIRQIKTVDVRESMANGGGPACLRLRVVADPATIDPRFLIDQVRLDQIETVIEKFWPESIWPGTIGCRQVVDSIESARNHLLSSLNLTELIDN